MFYQSFVTYQLRGHGVARPERQVVSYRGGLASILLQARAVLRQPPRIHQTMEIRFSLGRDVHDYRLTRTLDLHSARYPNGRCKENITELIHSFNQKNKETNF